jgi:hypothetical protein
MATNLVVYGPVKIPMDSGKRRITKENIRLFWEYDETIIDNHIDRKQGCYVFALRVGGGIKPWYVGKTKNRNGFKQEVFTDHKRGIYNDLLDTGVRGTPLLYFVAPPGGKMKVRADHITEIERFLIAHAKERNDDLCNKQNARLPEWSIEGVIRRGKGHPGKKNQEFQRMMGL